MPLPEEVIKEALAKVAEAKKRIKEMEGVVTDLRASGIEADKQQSAIMALRGELRKWEAFYELQAKRLREE